METETATEVMKIVSEALEATRAAHSATAARVSQNASLIQGQISWQVATQLGLWVVSILLAYGLINTRLQVLEVKYDRMTQDVQEMKADLKQVISLAHGVNTYPNGNGPGPSRETSDQH